MGLLHYIFHLLSSLFPRVPSLVSFLSSTYPILVSSFLFSYLLLYVILFSSLLFSSSLLVYDVLLSFLSFPYRIVYYPFLCSLSFSSLLFYGLLLSSPFSLPPLGLLSLSLSLS